MMKIGKMLLTAPLLLAMALPAGAQYRNGRAPRNNRGHQNYQNQQQFYNGVRDGGRGGNYYDPHYDHRQYRDRGGIGPGKGAAIGAAGGAVLGAIFGGGLKGTIIGGAAGAGIGAVIGQANQSHRDNSYGRH